MWNGLMCQLDPAIMIRRRNYYNSTCFRQQELQQSSDSRLGPTEDSAAASLCPVVWGIALVCWLWSVTTVFLPVEDLMSMGKKKSSPNEDFFFDR